MDTPLTPCLVSTSRPSIAETEARHTQAADSFDSVEQLHMSQRRRRLQSVLPPGEQTIHECWDCRVDFQLLTRPVTHEGYENDRYDASLFFTPLCRMGQQPCKSKRTMALHVGTHIGERL
ncbi:uncharacterized protein LOC144100339 [Amblyomma americanum]